MSYRHSGRISVGIHDDIWTDPSVTERHVLLRDDEATHTWNTHRGCSTSAKTDRKTLTQTHFERLWIGTYIQFILSHQTKMSSLLLWRFYFCRISYNNFPTFGFLKLFQITFWGFFWVGDKFLLLMFVQSFFLTLLSIMLCRWTRIKNKHKTKPCFWIPIPSQKNTLSKVVILDHICF